MSGGIDRFSGGFRLRDRTGPREPPPRYRSTSDDDCEPGELPLRLAIAAFFSGDDLQFRRLASFFRISPELIPAIRQKDAFVRFVSEYLITADVLEVINAVSFINSFLWDQTFDWTGLLREEIIGKVVQRIGEADSCAEKALYFYMLTELMKRYGDSCRLMIEMGYVATLSGAIEWVKNSDSEEVENVTTSFSVMVHEIVVALITFVECPLCLHIGDVLWTTSEELNGIDAAEALVGSLVAFTSLVKKGFPARFDASAIAGLAEAGRDGEWIIRALLDLIRAISDDGFLRALMEAGLAANLVEDHIGRHWEDSFLVYQFFTEIRLPPSFPGLLAETLAWLPEAPYLTQIEMLFYLHASFDTLESDALVAVVESPTIEIVGEILANDSRPETCLKTGILVGRILMAARAHGIPLSGRPHVLEESVTRALAKSTEDEVDAVLRGLLELLGQTQSS
jgi:hypothetical protein